MRNLLSIVFIAVIVGCNADPAPTAKAERFCCDRETNCQILRDMPHNACYRNCGAARKCSAGSKSYLTDTAYCYKYTSYSMAPSCFPTVFDCESAYSGNCITTNGAICTQCHPALASEIYPIQ